MVLLLDFGVKKKIINDMRRVCVSVSASYKCNSAISMILYTKAEILIDWLRRRVVQNSYICKLWYTKKKIKSFWHKKMSQCGTQIRPGKVGNWRIFESNWLNIESLIDSTLTVKLAQHWESNWLNIENQIDSTLRVQLTQIFSSYSLCPVEL